jgi:hypothetical protein
MKKKFLVIGHPRGGTGYMAMLLQSYGYSVGHEKMLADGISSWMHMVDAPKVPFGDPRAGTKYEYVIHAVRHPIKTVASMVGTIMAQQDDPLSVKFMARFIDTKAKNDIELAVKTYIAWHGLAARSQPQVRIQVENGRLELPKFLKSVKLPNARALPLPSKTYNSQEHDLLSWSDVRDAVEPELHSELIALARHFGYGKRS